MKYQFFSILWILLLITISCSNDDNVTTPDSGNPDSAGNITPKILSFEFSILDNNILQPSFEATIDQDSKTISLNLPDGTNLKNLIPNIETTESTTITPDGTTPIDFSSPVVFTITSKDNISAQYTATITSGSLRDGKNFTFSIVKENNAFLDNDYYAQISDEYKVISLEIPVDETASLKDLRPVIKTANGVVVSPISLKVQDFTDQTLQYEITLPDGRVEKYYVDIYKPFTLGAQRHALLGLCFKNLEQLAHWDIDKPIQEWSPDEILLNTSLNRVRQLTINGGNNLSIPPAIASLSDQLPIGINIKNFNLNEFPENLLKIESLISLELEGNSIETIPSDIKLLHRLQFLDLSKNKINFIPNEIVTLENLEKLSLQENELEPLPETICAFGDSLDTFLFDAGVCP